MSRGKFISDTEAEEDITRAEEDLKKDDSRAAQARALIAIAKYLHLILDQIKKK